MKKKYFAIGLAGIILIIIVVAIIIIILQCQISSTMKMFGDELPLIDYVIGKKYIKKEEGKDLNENSYVILFYDPKFFTNDESEYFDSILRVYYDFQELNDDDFEEGIKYVGPSNDHEKMWIITVYHDTEEAYVKYTKCYNTLLDYEQLITDYSNYEFPEVESYEDF